VETTRRAAQKQKQLFAAIAVKTFPRTIKQLQINWWKASAQISRRGMFAFEISPRAESNFGKGQRASSFFEFLLRLNVF
jgi:hypothetical protein